MALRRCSVMWQPFGGQSAARRTMTCEPGLGVPSPSSDTSTRISGVLPASHQLSCSLCRSRPIAYEYPTAGRLYTKTHAEHTCAALVPAEPFRGCCYVNPDLGPDSWCSAIDLTISVPCFATDSVVTQPFSCILYAVGHGVNSSFKE